MVRKHVDVGQCGMGMSGKQVFTQKMIEDDTKIDSFSWAIDLEGQEPSCGHSCWRVRKNDQCMLGLRES